MKMERGWFLAIAVVLISLVAASDACAQGLRVRWDIISLTNFNPITIVAGGQASALANDGSKILLTGSGTFVVGETDNVTGGGAWATLDKDGKVSGMGPYRVTGLVRWNEAPGTVPDTAVDHIGNKPDTRSGLAVLRVAYSDGTRGILVVSCHQPVGTPDTIFEGITTSKGFVEFWNREAPKDRVDGNRTRTTGAVTDRGSQSMRTSRFSTSCDRLALEEERGP